MSAHRSPRRPTRRTRSSVPPVTRNAAASALPATGSRERHAQRELPLATVLRRRRLEARRQRRQRLPRAPSRWSPPAPRSAPRRPGGRAACPARKAAGSPSSPHRPRSPPGSAPASPPDRSPPPTRPRARPASISPRRRCPAAPPRRSRSASNASVSAAPSTRADDTPGGVDFSGGLPCCSRGPPGVPAVVVTVVLVHLDVRLALRPEHQHPHVVLSAGIETRQRHPWVRRIRRVLLAPPVQRIVPL